MFFRIRCWVIVSVVSIIYSTNICAIEIEYSASAKLTVYDNITRIPEPMSNEIGKSVLATVSVYEDSAKLTGNFVASIEAIKYQRQLVPDETIGDVKSDATWTFIPKKFEWYVSDRFTQTAIDTLASDTPNNRQNTNAFTTGPNYIVLINRRNTLNFNIRAKDFKYEANNADNNRVSALVKWVYDINSSINVALNYEKEDVNFSDNINNSDFVRDDAYFQLNYDKRKSSLLMEYGETKITNDLGNYRRASRYLFDYRSTRRRTANSRLTISRSISDISGNVLNPDTEIDFATTAVNEDVFIDERIRVIHTELYRSGKATFDVFRATKKYSALTNLDQEEKGVNVRGDWDNTRHSRITAQARYKNTIRINLAPLREDDDSFYRLLYRYSIRRGTNLIFELNSFRRRSTVDAAIYDDNRAIISLQYVSI